MAVPYKVGGIKCKKQEKGSNMLHVAGRRNTTCKEKESEESAKKPKPVQRVKKIDAVSIFNKEHVQFYKHGLFSCYFLEGDKILWLATPFHGLSEVPFQGFEI